MIDVAQQYDHYQSSFAALEKKRQYLNYGYTVGSNQTFEDKQEQLCKEVFKLAKIQPDDVVVDVGFGSGEQDFLLAKMCRFRQLIGINISKKQVDVANQQALTEQLDDSLIFYCGKAEDMCEVGDSSADKVIAIECAMYFDRPRFYRTAARILKSGGYMVLADICLGPRLKFLAEYPNKFQPVGTLEKNRRQWEKWFQTKLIRNINAHTKQGAQESVFHILKMARKLPRSTRAAWLQLALTSQLVALGLQFQLVQYHLIVLRKLVKN